MTLPLQSFDSISPATFAAISAKLKALFGLQLDGVSGIASKDDYEFEYDYDTDTQNLRVQCVKKPFYVPAGMVISKLSQLVKDSEVV